MSETGRTFTTACPRNCYSRCSLRVRVEGDRLRAVEPNAQNRATPEGPCLKGLSYVERQHSPDRILYPLRRTAPPGRAAADGEFERVPWDEILDEIAERLLDCRRGAGPQGVLYYSASGTKGLLNDAGPAFWRLYGGYTTTYGDLCWPAGLEATRLSLGANIHNAPWDLENARLVVFWGKNAAETNIHQTVFVNRAIERGARVVVIDPRRTQTAEDADLLIRPRPGTDAAVALAVCHEIYRNDRVDGAFVERHVDARGFAERAAEWSPERAAEIAGVSARDIRRLAEWIATSPPVTINAGYGMQHYANSGQTMRAIIAILALTGNIGKPGAGWAFANLQSMVLDDVPDPLAFYPPEHPGGAVRVSISTARLGPDMLKTRDPALKVAWIERGNPVTQNPETHAVLRALRALDFRVVVDQFLTDTAREADIVLPAKTMFEQSDVIGAYWHPYLQLKQKVLDPPGEVKPETEIYRELAGRLGIDGDAVAAAIPGPGDAEIDAYLERRLAVFPGLSLERLRGGPVTAPGAVEVAFGDRRFPTPSGRIEVYSEEAARRWDTDSLPGYTPPAETPGQGAYHLLTPNTKNRIHSQFHNLASIRRLEPAPKVSIHPEDARREGIVDGATARIFNNRGELRLAALYDAGLRRGCVSITNGWWITQGGTVNFLSKARETDMGYGAAFHESAVRIEPAT